MEFLKRVYQNLNLPLLIFASYSMRVLYYGATYQDASILGIFAILLGFIQYLKTKDKFISENEFRNKVNLDIGEIKTTINGIKSSVNMQTKGNLFTKR